MLFLLNVVLICNFFGYICNKYCIEDVKKRNHSFFDASYIQVITYKVKMNEKSFFIFINTLCSL